MPMLSFFKYSAAGNDFVIMDNLSGLLELKAWQIRKLCDRHFGIGADGILLLEGDPEYDYRMVYFNADGSRGEMCGNGARALCAFAQRLDIPQRTGQFLADDGAHGYRIDDSGIWIEILVNPERQDVEIDGQKAALMNTGVPHLVLPVDSVADTPVNEMGYPLSRVSERFPRGANINFLEIGVEVHKVRTFERGVDAETLACGTGATAVALYLTTTHPQGWPVSLEFPGGVLSVDYRDDRYWLTGPVEMVFEGRTGLDRLRHSTEKTEDSPS
ncbi:MAG: diaminopimelate epimerase [Candidatus Marinimicrobia bacterium]|nr:diaminopimelate epimerase [Candidatus Neomarinimicrobiota bacterium]MCF7839428.1 diaminopimelate epimerase [Candidatus Neomarinimicrobiota bacterium]MCF7902914.1 diaminopimelate epimerase [Candidatus Neomarinimicrobiota bacterium]